MWSSTAISKYLNYVNLKMMLLLLLDKNADQKAEKTRGDH
jgi:hypothetical protein